MSRKRKKDQVSSSSDASSDQSISDVDLDSDDETKNKKGRRYPVRKRRKLQRRFSFSNFEPPPWTVPKGPGKKLKKIKVIEYHVTQTPRTDPIIRQLHFTLFSRPGKRNEIKKNILKFSGIPALKHDEEWQDFCHTKLMTKDISTLRDMYTFLGLKSTSDLMEMNKKEISGDIAEFLYKPSKHSCIKDKTPWVSEAEKKKREKRRKRREEKKSRKDKRKKGKKKDKSEKDSSSESDSSSSSSSEEEEEKKKGGTYSSLKPGDYCIEYSTTGRAHCKYSACKEIISKDAIRIGKIGTFGKKSETNTVDWYHYKCCFKYLTRKAKATTKKIHSEEDIFGFKELKEKDQAKVIKRIPESYPRDD